MIESAGDWMEDGFKIYSRIIFNLLNLKLFKDDILAKWKGDSSITYIETRQELEELLKKDEKIKSKY